jgi:uncharacterized protein YndB with AHSA1/START domain
MAKEEGISVVINRPVEEVFAFVADQSKIPLWQSFVAEAGLTSEGPMSAGSTYRYTFQLLGQRIETTGEFPEYEPNSKYSFKATSGPFPIKGGFICEAVEGGTKVTMWGEAEFGGFFKVAEPLALRLFMRQLETSLKSLKDILEAGA